MYRLQPTLAAACGDYRACVHRFRIFWAGCFLRFNAVFVRNNVRYWTVTFEHRVGDNLKESRSSLWKLPAGDKKLLRFMWWWEVEMSWTWENCCNLTGQRSPGNSLRERASTTHQVRARPCSCGCSRILLEDSINDGRRAIGSSFAEIETVSGWTYSNAIFTVIINKQLCNIYCSYNGILIHNILLIPPGHALPLF